MKIQRSSLAFRIALAMLAPLLATASLRAEILWDPEASSHTGNGGSFATLTGPGIPPGYGQTVGMGNFAYGGGNNQSGVFTFGFINNPAATPGFADTELSATVLVAGTTLTLYFDKGATDKINYLAIVGDPNASVTYELISDTRIKIVADVVDPVPSASGDNAAAFGLVIDYQSVTALDFKQAVFVTNMHHYDVGPPVTRPSGAAGINANGTNGSAAIFRAFLPTGFLTSIGITDPSQCKGYVDGLETPPGDFTREGLDNTLGFVFGDPGNPTNTVLKVVVVNDEWSPHDIQFGDIQTDPLAALRADLTRQISVAKKKLKKARTPAAKKKWKKKIRGLNLRLAALTLPF